MTCGVPSAVDESWRDGTSEDASGDRPVEDIGLASMGGDGILDFEELAGVYLRVGDGVRS